MTGSRGSRTPDSSPGRGNRGGPSGSPRTQLMPQTSPTSCPAGVQPASLPAACAARERGKLMSLHPKNVSEPPDERW